MSLILKKLNNNLMRPILCKFILISVIIPVWGVLRAGSSGIRPDTETNTSGEAVIISVPLDGRPVSDEYLEYLVRLGGDRFVTVSGKHIDKGYDRLQNGKWIFGNSEKVRATLPGLVRKFNRINTTVIINTSSYITNGLVGCRIPGNYDDDILADALSDLDDLTGKYSLPRYYVHVMIPRTIPETRGFDYRQDQQVHGLRYFYMKNVAEAVGDDQDESFTEVLVQFGYVKYKRQNGLILTSWEEKFLDFFEDKYIVNAPVDFKINGEPLPLVYMKIYQQATGLIKSLIDRVLKDSVDELVISVEDYNIPSFVHSRKEEDWVVKDAHGNPVKYSFSMATMDEIVEYLRNTFSEEKLNGCFEGKNNRINFVFGTDEIPQMIYARDLTRRTGIATRFNVNYDYDPDPVKSKNHIGFFDVATTASVIDQRIHFVTGASEGYAGGIAVKPSSRVFDLFVHNSDIPDQGDFTSGQAARFSSAVFDAYNRGHNVGVLDLRTNTVDWELFRALSSSPGNSIARLTCYSGWNTIGNSTGLGIAHAQVFGIIDSGEESMKILAERAVWQGKLLAQHLLEDALYNRKIKGEKPNDAGYINQNLTGILKSRQEYDSNGKPGGDYWVLRHFRNTDMRIGQYFYRWKHVSLASASLPFNRVFECRVNVDLRKILWKK
jgi:hypothetical protein